MSSFSKSDNPDYNPKHLDDLENTGNNSFHNIGKIGDPNANFDNAYSAIQKNI